MGRNIVICSDGTGNTFDKSVSNVTRLIKLLDLHDHRRQVVVYDQGIGTNGERLSSVKRYRDSIPDPCALHILDTPPYWWFNPASLPKRALGLGFGYGFNTNLREMYQKLSELYGGTDDKIYLFGFSRGAFTVRALAGLIYHCGLPEKGEQRFAECFGEAYRLYASLYEHRGDELEEIKSIKSEPKRNEEMSRWCENDKRRREADSEGVHSFQKKFRIHKDVKIHFLGVWDTVKSYGVIRPKILPHLRHNPCVEIVRDALALNERRSWFDATTWGQLDLDKKGALSRLESTMSVVDFKAFEEQDIEEVWFRGCHSDIGGGDAEAVTGMIALRWMLGEAVAVTNGIVLNENGKSVLSVEDPPGPAEIHESLSRFWKLAAYVHLLEIDNSGLYPARKSAIGKTGRRSPEELTRKGKIFVHRSVGNLHSIIVPVEHRCTRRPWVYQA